MRLAPATPRRSLSATTSSGEQRPHFVAEDGGGPLITVAAAESPPKIIIVGTPTVEEDVIGAQNSAKRVGLAVDAAVEESSGVEVVAAVVDAERRATEEEFVADLDLARGVELRGHGAAARGHAASERAVSLAGPDDVASVEGLPVEVEDGRREFVSPALREIRGDGVGLADVARPVQPHSGSVEGVDAEPEDAARVGVDIIARQHGAVPGPDHLLELGAGHEPPQAAVDVLVALVVPGLDASCALRHHLSVVVEVAFEQRVELLRHHHANFIVVSAPCYWAGHERPRSHLEEEEEL